MRALLYPYGSAARLCCALTTLPPDSFCRPLGEHYAQGFVTGISFLSASAGGASHISVIVVKFLTVPLNRLIKVLYHGIESISR